MADEKLNTGPEAQKTEEAPAPAVADPAHGEAAVPEHPPEQAGPAEPGDVVISAEQIDALMAEKRQAARAEVEKAEASREPEAGAPALDRPAAESEKTEKPRRGRPPKPEKRELFEQRHSRELILYDAAARYLKELKDSGEEITPKAWQREIDLLTAQKQVDTIDMKAMREELKAVERLRKAADQLARQGQDKSHDRGPER